MTQLDLFSLAAPPKKVAEKSAGTKAKEDQKEAMEEKEVFKKQDEEPGRQNAVLPEDSTAQTANVIIADVPVKIEEALKSTSSERTGDIIFEDNKITVKLKGRPAPVKKEASEVSENRGEEYPLPGKPLKVEPKKSIVTKQPKTEYSNALKEKLDSVKNSIKEGLLKDTLSEKKKKEKEAKPLQKRGRRSLKEVDAEVDLIDIPEDDLLFKKQYYSISEVARWFNVNTSLLRFWENEFDILKPKKNRKGDRLFRPEDVKNLQLIYQLLRQRKYSIEGAKEFLKSNRSKAETQMQLTQTLQKFKGFLLELKANLQ